MKRSILIIICAFVAQVGFSQESKNKEIIETTFEVDGVCGMCKERIENAVMRTKGVKLADWNIESHQLKVTYKSSKTNEDELHAAVNAVGHDTKKSKANDEAYSKIHHCCQYRGLKDQEDHKNK